MIKIKKLSTANFKDFKYLLIKAKKQLQYNLDFDRNYANKNALYRYIMRKMVTLVYEDEKPVGYIWTDAFSFEQQLKINDMYFVEECLPKINSGMIKILKNNNVIYEAFENTYTSMLVSKLNMTKYRETHLLKLKGYTNNKIQNNNIYMKKCRKKLDRKLRCEIQNDIFYEAQRIPLTVSDIEYDENQDYYIDDLCYFMIKDNYVIGYGQIIFSKGAFFIVNFGIVQQYRGRGYGKILLNELIYIAHKTGIKELYIQVDKRNYIAERLYLENGFERIGNISFWKWDNKVRSDG